MNCKRVYQESFLLIDNEVDSEVGAALLQHLAGCPGCQRHFEHYRKLVFVVRERCRRQSAPEGLRIRIQATLRRTDTV
ncbi:MAG: mycothiol system anti-sigma-R factor [Thermoanaerobaculia bacterium]|nr:mycothiol system anti-sigma-R factor [Thermoanaerobaculia bacterium]